MRYTPRTPAGSRAFASRGRDTADADPDPAAYRELQAHQRIKHIPGIQALANKAQL